MAQVNVAELVVPEERATRARVAMLLGRGVFGSLLLLVVVTAIPYGTNESWYKSAFVCAVFTICIVAIIHSLISGESRIGGPSVVLLSMLALAGFAVVQTISFGSSNPDPVVNGIGSWNAISADPYQTRFFAIQILALTTALALLYRYVNSERRVGVLIHVVIGVAIASAVFGMLRQTLQHETGFVLPLMKPDQGYGQFINKNHFAYLMEMALGLGLGMGLARGFSRDRALMYGALLVPVWTALVLSNSRGGILAMLAQVVVAVMMLTSGFGQNGGFDSDSPFERFGRSLIVRGALVLALIAVIMFGTIWVGGDRLVSSFGLVTGEFTSDVNSLRQGATRNEIWAASWKMFTAHPIAGVGLGAYWAAITAYHDASGTLTPQEAHNDYLELLSSGGLIGLAIGIVFAVAVYRRARQNLMSSNNFQRALCFAALLGLTGVLVHSLVDFGLHMLINALVFLVLIMLATTRVDLWRPEK